jgi:hypothetical protein
LGVFDEIYFDDYPLDITKDSKSIEKTLSMKRFNMFTDFCIQNHTRIGSKICWYCNGCIADKVLLSSDTEPFVNVTVDTMDIHIPETCCYRDLKKQKCLIPLLEKIKEFDFMEAQQFALRKMKENDI